METTTNNHAQVTPPPANTMLTLASDLLAMRVKQLLTVLAAHNFEPLEQLRQALDTYEQVRIGGAIVEASDPQRMAVANWEPAPITERSVHHG